MLKWEKKKQEFSKKLICDIRSLLWIITISSIVLAFYCVKLGYLGALGWITALVGLPWAAHGAVCASYMNLAKSDHKVGGITYESVMAQLTNSSNEEATI